MSADFLRMLVICTVTHVEASVVVQASVAGVVLEAGRQRCQLQDRVVGDLMVHQANSVVFVDGLAAHVCGTRNRFMTLIPGLISTQNSLKTFVRSGWGQYFIYFLFLQYFVYVFLCVICVTQQHTTQLHTYGSCPKIRIYFNFNKIC